MTFMNEITNTTTQKRGFLSYVEDVFKGAALGLFSWIPFSSYRNLKDTLDVEPKEVQNRSFEEELKDHLKHDIGLWLGLLIGAIFFFSIHVSYLLENFYTPVYGALLAFIVPSLVAEVYLYVRRATKVNPRHIFISLGLMVVIFLLSFLGFKFIRVDFARFLALPTYGYVFLLMVIAGFLTGFSGIGWGTIFFMVHFYSQFAEGVYPLSMLKKVSTFAPLVVLALLGALNGAFFALFLNNHEKVHQKDYFLEKRGINIGFYLAGLVLIPLYLLKAPFFSGIADSWIAEKITIYTSVIAGFFIALALTVKLYSFHFKKKDKKHASR